MSPDSSLGRLTRVVRALWTLLVTVASLWRSAFAAVLPL